MSTTDCTDSCFRIFNSDDINDIIMDMGTETRNVVIYDDSCDGNDS